MNAPTSADPEIRGGGGHPEGVVPSPAASSRFEFDAHRLTQTREALGYRKSDLARAARITDNYVSDIERGRRRPSETVLRRLAQALEVAPEELLVEGSSPLPPARPTPPSTPAAARRDPLVGTPMEVAELMSVSVGTVYTMIHEGRIPFCHLGRRKVGIPWATLEEWLRAEATSSLAPYCPRCPCFQCEASRSGGRVVPLREARPAS